MGACFCSSLGTFFVEKGLYLVIGVCLEMLLIRLGCTSSLSQY